MSENKTKTLAGWTHVYSGKVRDIYVPEAVGSRDESDEFLIVASDRISAFDYILPTEIPDKGKVLTQLSLWWFEQLADITANHVISDDVPQEVSGRAMITRRLEMFPIECVIRGYLTGSGMAEYRENGTVCGIPLQPGIVESGRLDEPIFTPAAKADLGEHDENISFAQCAERVGEGAARELREKSLAVYTRAREIAAERGIIIADTKLEFGSDRHTGEVVLGDEVLTPDSSRFWLMDVYEPGHVQPSLDKQFVRDWLKSPEAGWDSASGELPPALPADVVAKTRDRYIEVYERLTGETWNF